VDPTEAGYLREALRLAAEGMRQRRGGPFGAVIVRDGAIVGRGGNEVTSRNDPTAHAEVVAIRDACRRLGTFRLDGATVYCSCEPCPMCLAAIYWARIARVVYAGSQVDAAAAGFDDAAFYRELALPPDARRVPAEQALRAEAVAVFDAWRALPDRQPY
jgi:tRNA(Arg) A34 adenosine deaminase TadA